MMVPAIVISADIGQIFKMVITPLEGFVFKKTGGVSHVMKKLFFIKIAREDTYISGLFSHQTESTSKISPCNQPLSF